MTLLDIINTCPVQDYSDTQVWVENNPTYDYKGDSNGILLISHPFDNSLEIEPLTLEEIINFSIELDFSEEDIFLICEHEMVDLKSSEWQGTKLVLYF